MINIDFFWGLVIFMSSALAIVMFFWISQPLNTHKINRQSQFVWLCSICAYTYITTKEEKISKCPRCANFNKREP